MSGEKIRRRRGRWREEGMLAYPIPYYFSCSHLFAPSPQSKCLEQAKASTVRIKASVPMLQVSISTINYKAFHTINNAAGKY